MTITYAGITLSNAGKVNMQQDAYSMSCQFDCVTFDYNEILGILSHAGPVTDTKLLSGYHNVQVLSSGQKQTLVINGTSYSNVVIIQPLQITEDEAPGVWHYTVKFVQHTAS